MSPASNSCKILIVRESVNSGLDYWNGLLDRTIALNDDVNLGGGGSELNVTIILSILNSV